jgi:hypothetical protein
MRKELSSLEGPVLDVVNVAYELYFHKNEHRRQSQNNICKQ